MSIPYDVSGSVSGANQTHTPITVIQEETKRTEEKEEAGYDHQRGQNYEHCKRSTKPRDLTNHSQTPGNL